MAADGEEATEGELEQVKQAVEQRIGDPVSETGEWLKVVHGFERESPDRIGYRVNRTGGKCSKW